MKDLFSGHSTSYAAFRPTYPKELYDFILSKVKHHQCAWDVGTGNGQVAIDLAPHFNKIEATDISVKQIQNAAEAPNIAYTACAAEKTPFEAGSFDLITIGQALHWFDHEKFYSEVRRVSKRDAVISAWGYALLSVSPEIDVYITDFYSNVIGPYWDPERRLIDNRYSTIQFPFTEFAVPSFEMKFKWTLDQFSGYITTWSAVQQYMKLYKSNPVDGLIDNIGPFWGNNREITFPLFLKCGMIF